MYRTQELVEFTIEEFRRGLEGLTAEEAVVRHPKADGTSMNAASWIVAHVTGQWATARALVGGGERLAEQPGRDGTPPPWPETRATFDAVTGDLGWLEGSIDDTMSTPSPRLEAIWGSGAAPGDYLMRAVLHTWFHMGEINGIRQLLGHPEIAFVGSFEGRLRWVAEAGIEAG
ncbi:MAG: DinB family protein [Dehalococcoidia bacterium]